MENLKEKKINNNKIIKIFIMILIIIIILVIGIFAIIKLSYKKYNVLDISECVNKICDKDFKFNKNIINIKNDKNNIFTIKVNNKELFTGGGNDIKLENKIYTFDNVILFSIFINSNQMRILQLITVTGKQLLPFNQLDGAINVIDFSVNENEILINTSRFIDKDTVIYGQTRETMVNIDNCESFTTYKDKVVAGKYKLTYLDDNKFSDIETIETTTLENYKDFKNLCK